MGFWGPKLDANGPANIIYPEILKGDSFTVDGKVLNVIGLDKHPKRTFVWIPSIKAVVGGIPVFGDLHLWMADSATPEQRTDWKAILDEIVSLQPEIVIPGHAQDSAPTNLKSVKFSQNYLSTYEKQLAKANNAKNLIDVMNKKYPNAKLSIALEIGAKVSMGEMKW